MSWTKIKYRLERILSENCLAPLNRTCGCEVSGHAAELWRPVFSSEMCLFMCGFFVCVYLCVSSAFTCVLWPPLNSAQEFVWCPHVRCHDYRVAGMCADACHDSGTSAFKTWTSEAWLARILFISFVLETKKPRYCFQE